MRTLPTLAVILAMTVPASGCKEPVAQDLPPMADGCPGYTTLEPRLMAAADYVTKPEDYKDNQRIEFASIPANEAGHAAMLARAKKDHDHMRAVTYVGEGAWDVRVFTWSRSGKWGSYYGNRTPDGAWVVEAITGQATSNGAETTPPATGKMLKGNLGTTKAKRMTEIVGNACLAREPIYYDGGAPNGPGCSNGTDYFIEIKLEGRVYSTYQGCRAHGLAGETGMILRSLTARQKSVR